MFIRQFGLVGQQPDADLGTGKSCINAPGPTCYEGITNPPGGVHQVYSAGTKINRVYLAYGVDNNGVIQIVDRETLLNGCKAADASPNCATRPTQADLLYPQVSYITMRAAVGGDQTMAAAAARPVPVSVAAGLKAVEKMGEAPLEAELYRLRGEALLADTGTVSEAETAMRQSIDVARRQNARSWELRGAMSLARLRRQQGRPSEARDLLAPVYSWFTEGFDTADLKEAKALLEKLTEPAIAAEE